MDAIVTTFIGAEVPVLPFDENNAAEAGGIRADLEAMGQPTGAYDILIAGHARCRGATLVASNRRELARVLSLVVTEWSA